MIVAGIDIGSLSGKCVLMETDGETHRVLTSMVILTLPDSEETAHEVLRLALEHVGVSREDLSYIVATGYGRVNVSFADKTLTEISCHAKGVNWTFPDVRTILDIGGQDSKVISINAKGRVVNFLMNDKCAAGAGRYLERIAERLGATLEEIGELSLRGMDTPEEIRSHCTVFAEQDVTMLLRHGKRKEDIMAGACDALVERIGRMVKRIGLKKEFTVSGGVAKNIGVVKRLEKTLQVQIETAQDPQILGALGAAVFACEAIR